MRMISPRLRALLLFVLALTMALAFSYREQLDIAALQSWVRDAGIVAPLLFITLYALATVLFLPGSVVTLAGGALFGPVWGTLYNLVGATLGALLAFLLTRHLAAHWVQTKIENAGGWAQRLVRGVEAEGWRFVAFTRLVPLFPFNLLNYALGLTRIPLLHYVVTSFVFMLPGTVAYTYLGFAGREAVAGSTGTIRNALIALALLAVVAFVPRLVARLRLQPMLAIAELKARADNAQGLILDVRSADDFVGEQGHIAGAFNLPLEELARRVDELGDDPTRPIAIVCRTDRRSAEAAVWLARRGFTDARVVDGGMTAWLAQGWPVARSASEAKPPAQP